MGSRKRSARRKEQESFLRNQPDLSDVFATEERQQRRAELERERALTHKACTSKVRHPSRSDALEAIATCSARGRRGLSCYHCPHCGGWHLTSHGVR